MFSKTKAFSGFAAVDQLVERGVTFVRYDGMEQDERGIMLQERTD